MVRGKAPVPTKLKLVAGVAKNRINHDEPQPDEGVPQCPSTDELVVQIWDYTVVQLRRMQVLTMADRDLLYAFCEAVAMHRRASAEIARDGIVLHVGGGLGSAPHPALRAQAQAQQVIKSLGTEFGLTPAARSRIKVADQKAPEKAQGASRLLSS